MVAQTPFGLLQDIDRRCREGAKGLPTGVRVEEDWVGVGFKLDGQTLVANMGDVAEILTPPETIRIPGVKEWVKGLANVRGSLMPILDMGRFLGNGRDNPGGDKRILVINKNDIVAGLLVEEVFGLRRFKPATRTPLVSSDHGALQPFLEGAFTAGDTSWNIFSIDKLVTSESFLEVV